MLLTLASATLESIIFAINAAKLGYTIIETTVYVPYSIYSYLTREEKPKEEEMIEISKKDFQKLLDRIECIEKTDKKIENILETKF